MSYYYWDNEFKTELGETLMECYQKYGLGKQNIKRNHLNYIMDVIFLDDRLNYGNSWCLKMYNKKRGTNIPMTLYEEHKIYGPYPFK